MAWKSFSEKTSKSWAAAAQVVKVAPGYARNFLLPKRLAVAANESNKKIVEQERQAHLRKEAKLRARRRIWPSS
jgi:ribosomal protein L9